MSSDRTEKASPQKRQKAIEKGDRPRSRDLVSSAGLLAGSLTLGWAVRLWLPVWRHAYEQSLVLMRERELTGDALSTAMVHIIVTGAAPCLLVMLAAALASLVVAVAQNQGITIHPDGLTPRWSKLNPFENAKHIVSTRSLVRLGRSLVPVALLAYEWFRFLTSLAQLPAFSLAHIPEVLGDAYELLVNTAWILLAWSLIDFLVEWRQWESRLKMTKQEMREEFKESEGNPQMKSRIRGLQRQMRRRNLRADVRKASVVITNPTHYAVALSFDMSTMEAPKVLAKGRDLFAAQIREEARWAGIPLVENPPLARSLYRAVEPGQNIPGELYAAVAAILAYLFRQEAEERMRRMRAHQQTSSAAVPGASTQTSGARATRDVTNPGRPNAAPRPATTQGPTPTRTTSRRATTERTSTEPTLANLAGLALRPIPSEDTL